MKESKEVQVFDTLYAACFNQRMEHLHGNMDAREFDEAEEKRMISRIIRYCAKCWSNDGMPPADWSDATQAVFQALLTRLPDRQTWQNILQLETPERRELVRVIDMVKKRDRRSRKFVPITDMAIHTNNVHMLSTKPIWSDVEEIQSKAKLSEDQKRILDLTRKGWEIFEIAALLRKPTHRISHIKYKAIQRLRERLDFVS